MLLDIRCVREGERGVPFASALLERLREQSHTLTPAHNIHNTHTHIVASSRHKSRAAPEGQEAEASQEASCKSQTGQKGTVGEGETKASGMRETAT